MENKKIIRDPKHDKSVTQEFTKKDLIKVDLSDPKFMKAFKKLMDKDDEK
jgi:hypothetical protein